MITNPWHYDKCDKVLLSASMLKCGSDFELITAGDWGIIEDVAELATQLLPGFCYEGAEWDGCVWIEILEDVEEGSLAHWLAILAAEDAHTVAGLEDAVGGVLQRWLVANGRTLRSHALDEEVCHVHLNA